MKVCIVDDAAINLTLMQALVSKIDDCKAVCFREPIPGLQYCIDEDVDLVIVDFMMPNLDGIEFIRRLRAVDRRHDVPILMVTADHEKEVRHRALQSGATDFLTKPMDRVEFTSRVRNMLDIRRSHLLLADKAAMLAEEVKKATAEIFAREREAIFRLSKAAEFRDPETGAHILRMAHYSELIARRLGWDDAGAEMMLQAAPMHDVGKLGTPDYILLKPGRLSPEEFEVMKRHATIGWEILRDSASPVLQMAAEIALTHHEKFDGSGYPKGLAGEAIPLTGRIVAVADVFDALTSARPYKAAWTIDRALTNLHDSRGSHFDPACVDAFLADMDAVLAIRDSYQDPQEAE
jgi:response regulator RpfG family c-di-GMP phosphodiesterase